ncbi:Glycosyl hydrolase [Pyrenophora tritici-repentis]|nr:Glycosyl hydrolase [Pyrenophora tritici-repentis]
MRTSNLQPFKSSKTHTPNPQINSAPITGKINFTTTKVGGQWLGIASYDLTNDVKYLNTAKDLFQDMTGGWNTPCKGGIWWSKDRDAIASISNELFLSVAAHLANRHHGKEKDDYANWAQMEWDWFKASGVIGSNNLVNDGIDPATCKNDGKNNLHLQPRSRPSRPLRTLPCKRRRHVPR